MNRISVFCKQLYHRMNMKQACQEKFCFNRPPMHQTFLSAKDVYIHLGLFPKSYFGISFGYRPSLRELDPSEEEIKILAHREKNPTSETSCIFNDALQAPASHQTQAQKPRKYVMSKIIQMGMNVSFQGIATKHVQILKVRKPQLLSSRDSSNMCIIPEEMGNSSGFCSIINLMGISSKGYGLGGQQPFFPLRLLTNALPPRQRISEKLLKL